MGCTGAAAGDGLHNWTAEIWELQRSWRGSHGELRKSQQIKQSITSAYGVKWFLLGGRWVSDPPIAQVGLALAVQTQFQADLNIYLRKKMASLAGFEEVIFI